MKIIITNIKGFDEYSAMRYKYLFLAFLVVFASLLEGCSKGGTVCDSGLKPKVTATSPIGQNDTLLLSVIGIDEPKTYQWEGPNGFTSHEASPKIINPVKGKDQVYSVTVVTNGGCTYTSSSAAVTVTGPWNPCGLDSNKVSLVGVVRFSVGTVTGTTTSNNNYKIEGISSSSSITVEFPNNQPPVEGIYNVQSGSGALPAGAARVVVQVLTTPQWTASSSGQIYVAVDGATTTISFCDLTFTSTSPTGTVSTSNGSANFMWTP